LVGKEVVIVDEIFRPYGPMVKLWGSSAPRVVMMSVGGRVHTGTAALEEQDAGGEDFEWEDVAGSQSSQVHIPITSVCRVSDSCFPSV
jgi:hypothetical protein